MHFVSSSSLGLSSGEDNGRGWEIRRRSPGLGNIPGREELNRVVGRLATEANREIQEIERRRKEKVLKTPEEAGTQQKATRQAADIHDLTETEEDDEAAPHG